MKIIQADSFLSVQVHPDDKTAAALEGKGACGKTECWLVLDAEKDAKIVCGLNQKLSADELNSAVKNETLSEKLNFISVKKGDFIFIPAGTVHAIGGGLRLLEVQQNCDITYRLYDWGRGRELHVEKSLKSIRQTQVPKIAELESFECEYFSMSKKNVRGGYSFFARGTKNSAQKKALPELLFIESGANLSATWTDTDGNRTENMYLYKEEIFAVLPGEKITVEGNGCVIRIIPK